MIEWLDENDNPEFPDTRRALRDPNGLLAAGGGMSPLWLHAAYRAGIFPWHSDDDPRLWWSPAPRAVILPDTFRIPRTIRKELSRTSFGFTANLAFRDVMQACATTHEEQDGGTWIQNPMLDAYARMHAAGYALSVECWSEHGTLCGGLYGLRIGRAFYGESMFSRRSNSAKLAFALAAPLLFERGVEIIDCQMHTEHLARFGLIELARASFEQHLHTAIRAPLTPPLPTVLKPATGLAS